MKVNQSWEKIMTSCDLIESESWDFCNYSLAESESETELRKIYEKLWSGRKWKCDIKNHRKDGERMSVVEEIWLTMDLQKERLRHLQAISREETNCTLITKEGERTEVQLFFMAVLILSSMSELWI